MLCCSSMVVFAHEFVLRTKLKFLNLLHSIKKKGETYQKDKIENELIWQENLRLKTRPP